jgi:succinate dehydrogenase / fumarate reductase flavoprotein subunit
LIEHDVVVVGAGLSGLRASIAAKEKGADVALISKIHPVRSHSDQAQGGINASLGPNDSWEKHSFDTVKGSDYLADQDAVEILCKDAPRAIMELDHWGTLFNRTDEGRIAQRPFGGAGFPRTCYAADKTGHALQSTLYERVMKEGVKVYEEWFVTSLIVENNVTRGLVALELRTGELQSFKTKTVILATGGAGQIYARTTNSMTTIGDGIAMAYRVGAQIEDMEFIQFHPTSLYGSNILITEAARGEGGHLINANGERFMKKYAPEAMELAPRDIVSRAIQTEIIEGRGFEGGYVHLDLRHLGEQKINERLPQIRDLSRSFSGIDPVKEPIPIQPAQHYTMGGVATDNDGQTSVKGLYAAGENACVSVHGANRLGGNSLLDCIVFGKIVGEKAAEESRKIDSVATLQDALKAEEERIRLLLTSKEGEKTLILDSEMGEAMSEEVGIFRTKAKLMSAQKKIAKLVKRFGNICVEDSSRQFNTSLVEVLELGYMLTVAEVIVTCAIARRESRGAHYRLDYSKRDDKNWLVHSVAVTSAKGPAISYKPVTITKFKPVARGY